MAENRDPNPGGKPQQATPQGRQNAQGLPRSENMQQIAGKPVVGAEGQLSVSAIPNVNARLSPALKALLPERHIAPGGFMEGIGKNGGKTPSGGGT
jgi:hypothetical protein